MALVRKGWADWALLEHKRQCQWCQGTVPESCCAWCPAEGCDRLLHHSCVKVHWRSCHEGPVPAEYQTSRPHRDEAEEYRWLFMSGSEDRTGSEQRNLLQKVRALRPLGLLCDFPRNAAVLSLERHLGELGYTTVRCSVNCALMHGRLV